MINVNQELNNEVLLLLLHTSVLSDISPDRARRTSSLAGEKGENAKIKGLNYKLNLAQ